MVKIPMPQVIDADDYHEFDVLKGTLNKYRTRGSRKVRYFEIGFNGKYLAVFYQTSKREAEEWLKLNRPDLWEIYTEED